MSVELNELKEELDNKVLAKNFDKAASVQNNIDDLTSKKRDLEEKLTATDSTAIADETQAAIKVKISDLLVCLVVYTIIWNGALNMK